MESSLAITLRAYVIAALRALANGTPAIALTDASLVRFDDPQGLIAQRTSVPLTVSHVIQHACAFEDLPETIAAVEALAAESRFRPVGTTRDQPPTDPARQAGARDTLVRLVMAYAGRNGDFELRDDILSLLLEDFETAWLSPTVHHWVITPLLSCGMEVSPIDLDDLIALTPLTPDWKRALYRPPSVFHAAAIMPDDFMTAGCALFATYETADPGDHTACQAIWTAAVRAVRALRLLKAGDVYPAVMYDRVVPADLRDGSCESRVGDWRAPSAFERTPYHILAADVSSLEALYAALAHLDDRSLRLPHGLEEPLREFERTYGHLHVEDKLKSLGTVLDTALLADPATRRARGPKGVPIARRGARLIANSHAEHDTIALLDTLYRVRNPLTHEAKTLRDRAALIAKIGLQADEFVRLAFEVSRAILRTLVTQIAADDTATTATVAARLRHATGT